MFALKRLDTAPNFDEADFTDAIGSHYIATPDYALLNSFAVTDTTKSDCGSHLR